MFPFNSKVALVIGLNRRGVYLKKADLDLLLFLYHQRLLSTEQLYRFHILIQPIHKRRLSDKLNKFEKHGLVLKNPNFLHKNAGVKINVFRIGAAGLMLLNRFGLVREDEIPPKLYRNLDHALGIQHIVMDAIETESNRSGRLLTGGGHMFVFNQKGAGEVSFINTSLNVKLYPTASLPLKETKSDLKAMEDYKTEVKESRFPIYKQNSLTSFFPADFPIYKKDDGSYHLIPDWTFLMNDHVFHIEADGGTERISKGDGHSTSIEGKLSLYIDLAKSTPKKVHNILFISLDDSVNFFKKSYGKKDVRIRNLKREIASVDDVFQPNLNIFFLRLERIKELWPLLLQKADGSYDKKLLFIILLNSLHLNSDYFPYDIKLLDSAKDINKYLNHPLGLIYPIKRIYHLKRRADENIYEGPLKRILIPVMMIEGDLYCHELVTYYSELIAEGSLPYGTKIIAIYEHKNSMMEDVFRSDAVSQHVILVNLEEIQYFREPAKFYSCKGKEVIYFE